MKEQKIFIEGRAGRLETQISGFAEFDSNAAIPIIGIMCHPHPLYQGTMDNKVVTTVVKAWQSLGLLTVRFNFRGVSESEGSYGEGIGEVEDLLAVLQWVQTKHPGAKIWLGGFSFGGFIAWKAALHSTPTGLLTIAPALRFFDLNSLKKPECPWLIVQGEKDEVVPVEEVKHMVQFLTEEALLFPASPPLELITVPDTSHFFHGHLVELSTVVQRFMRPLLD